MPFLELTPEQLKMIEPVVQVLHQARDLFQAQCAGLEEWQIALYSIVAYLIISTIFSFLWQEEPLFKRLKLIVFRLGKKVRWLLLGHAGSCSLPSGATPNRRTS